MSYDLENPMIAHTFYAAPQRVGKKNDNFELDLLYSRALLHGLLCHSCVRMTKWLYNTAVGMMLTVGNHSKNVWHVSQKYTHDIQWTNKNFLHKIDKCIKEDTKNIRFWPEL